MADWIERHRSSISFVVYMTVGLVLLVVGVGSADPALLALGAGAIGLPGFSEVSRRVDDGS